MSFPEVGRRSLAADVSHKFPQRGGHELAKLAYRQIYGEDVEFGDLAVRDEYLGWVERPPEPIK